MPILNGIFIDELLLWNYPLYIENSKKILLHLFKFYSFTYLNHDSQ